VEKETPTPTQALRNNVMRVAIVMQKKPEVEVVFYC